MTKSDHGASSLEGRVTSDPATFGGRPIIRGTRVKVQDILDLLAHGATVEEICEDFPYLEEADIRASLAYAASAIDHPVIAAQ